MEKNKTFKLHISTFHKTQSRVAAFCSGLYGNKEHWQMVTKRRSFREKEKMR